MKTLPSAYKSILLCTLALLLVACATPEAPPPDHSALINNRPDSILVLPPLNATLEEDAVAAILASSTAPLSERGYYVVPVTNMMETFQQNGLFTADDIHHVSPAKLRAFFGADAALYMEVDKYGVRFVVLDSVIEIGVTAKLVDLRSGMVLWQNRVDIAHSTRGNNTNPLALLVSAVINQIGNTLQDNGYPLSKQAMGVLFQGNPNGLIPGRRLQDSRQ